MLELNQLTGPVAEMAEMLAGQRESLLDLAERARQKLAEHAQVNEELRDKLKRAAGADASWRGAEPLGQRLDERRSLPSAQPATLIASDGSQIYPDAHGIALYFLVNVGAIVLRQGSGQAPDTITRSQLFFSDQDLYDDSQRLIETDRVNARRDLWELQMLVRLASQERQRLGGDLDRMLVALADGPLLLWMPQRLTDTQQAQRVEEFASEFDALRKMQAAPIGYVDRPRSANVLRLLHLADLPAEQIDKETLRANRYRSLTDRALFYDLAPGQRTALFAATSEINETYGKAGHRIYFCYLNIAMEPGPKNARIVRIEAPEWIAQDEDWLDTALAAVWADCRLTGYPYVLTRAHELALVSRHEREAFEQMLRVEFMRLGLLAEESAKQQQKRWLG